MQPITVSPAFLDLPLDILRLLFQKYLNMVAVFFLRCCCRKLRSLILFDISLLRLRLLKSIAERGYVHLMKWFLDTHRIRLGKEAFNKDTICSASASVSDHQTAIKMLRLLLERGAQPGMETAKQIGARGSVEMMQLLAKERCVAWDEVLLGHAAQNNQMAFMKLILDENPIGGKSETSMGA